MFFLLLITKLQKITILEIDYTYFRLVFFLFKNEENESGMVIFLLLRRMSVSSILNGTREIKRK